MRPCPAPTSSRTFSSRSSRDIANTTLELGERVRRVEWGYVLDIIPIVDRVDPTDELLEDHFASGAALGGNAARIIRAAASLQV
jgi:hypothetical protein